ncbi:MAG: lysophospholipid acyltransferase family protein [candidate division WOR-3 bacterium]
MRVILRLAKKSRLFEFLLVYFFIFVTKIIFKTIKYKIYGLECYLKLKSEGKNVVFTIWHGQLALFYPMSRFSKICGLVSRSRDGELAATIIRHFGFCSVRGSSSKGGFLAIVEAKKYLQSGYDIVITVDGPKGPKFSVKPGAVFLAIKSGCVLIPVVSRVNKYVRLKSWDEFIFPKPFSRLEVFLGEPICFDNVTTRKSDLLNATTYLKTRMLEMTKIYASFYLESTLTEVIK